MHFERRNKMNDSQKPSVVFLEGKTVNLRPLSKEDVPTITRWINNPRVRQFVATTFPQSEKQEEEWVNKLGSDEKNIVLCIETKEGRPIGVMGVHKINWVWRTCETGALIGEEECWGKGYGTDAKMHLLDYIFNTLGLRKVCSTVIAYNERSLRYSLHCGYKVEGKLRKQVFRKGKCWDLIHLGLFKEEWQPVWKKYQKTGKVR